MIILFTANISFKNFMLQGRILQKLLLEETFDYTFPKKKSSSSFQHFIVGADFGGQ